MQEVINIGDRCVSCDQDTSFGSGLFVNRIPADGYLDGNMDANPTLRRGWMCAECQSYDCDQCGKPIDVDEDEFDEDTDLRLCPSCTVKTYEYHLTVLVEIEMTGDGRIVSVSAPSLTDDVWPPAPHRSVWAVDDEDWIAGEDEGWQRAGDVVAAAFAKCLEEPTGSIPELRCDLCATEVPDGEGQYLDEKRICDGCYNERTLYAFGEQ
jgi:hypothetical protein